MIDWDDRNWALLDNAMRALEDAWQRGPDPELSQFILFARDDPKCPAFLARLVAVDRECRRRSGQQKAIDEYLAEWPQLQSELNFLAELDQEGPTGDCQSVDTNLPGRAKAAESRALRIRCPHCHSRLTLGDTDPSNEITCPSCGSHFNLVSDQSTGCSTSTYPKTIGHFTLLEQVGEGQFGTVWRAHDSELDRTVAIKIPRHSQLDTIETGLFFKEAQAAAQITHPNIVGVHELGREGDSVYVVSDFIQGVSLEKWLSAERFTPREAAQLCVKIAEALHAAHEAGVVHRDLKPSNIMLDTSGAPHITDFGLAKRSAVDITMTMEGQLLGTPAYMPPEQARGEGHEADRRNDVYSLGVILFRLLTGELPFRGDLRMLIVQILRDEPPPPRKLNYRVPRDLETICLKCLQKDPNRRYSTAQELADDLRRHLDGKPIQSRPVAKAERAWRWCRHNPLVTGLSATAVVLLATAAVVGMLGYLSTLRALRAVELEREKTKTALSEERSQRTRAEMSLYLNRIVLAQQNWLDNNVAKSDGVLEDCQPELRHWEWGYLKRLCHLDLLSLSHSDRVNSVAFSPDGKRLVSGSDDGKVRVWNATTGEERLPHFINPTGLEHVSPVTSVAFSPRGNRIASAASLGLIIWDAATGEPVEEGIRFGQGKYVAFSPDGTTIAAVCIDTVVLWDFSAENKHITTLCGHVGSVTSLAFEPDGKRIASASDDRTIKIWDTMTDKEMRELRGHDGTVTGVAFSPNGSRIASGSEDWTVKVWETNMKNPKAITLRGHDGPITCVVFSPDGKTVASASSDKTIRLWDATTGKSVLTLRGHADLVSSVVYSPDGRRIASASHDKTAKVWDANGGLFVIHAGTKVSSFALSPDGKQVALAESDNKKVSVWDASTGTRLFDASSHVFSVDSVVFSFDGRIASAGPMGMKLWDSTTGKSPDARMYLGSGIRVAFSPDGRQIAAISRMNKTIVNIRELATDAVVQLEGHSGSITSLAYSRDGKRIVSGSTDEKVKVWDAIGHKEILTFREHESPITSAMFSPDDKRIASASHDKTIRVWDAATGEMIFLPLCGHTDAVTAVAFSPDGRRIVSGGRDKRVILWELETGTEVLVVDEFSDEIAGVAFSPQGDRIAAACRDGTVKIWDSAIPNGPGRD